MHIVTELIRSERRECEVRVRELQAQCDSRVRQLQAEQSSIIRAVNEIDGRDELGRLVYSQHTNSSDGDLSDAEPALSRGWTPEE